LIDDSLLRTTFLLEVVTMFQLMGWYSAYRKISLNAMDLRALKRSEQQSFSERSNPMA
jgi:hypothetical protein